MGNVLWKESAYMGVNTEVTLNDKGQFKLLS